LSKRDEIVDYFVHRERYAYPVYDLGYRDCLKSVMAYLDGLKNLKLIGRSGTFTYMGQYRAMEAGSNAADEILSEIFKNLAVVKDEDPKGCRRPFPAFVGGIASSCS